MNQNTATTFMNPEAVPSILFRVENAYQSLDNKGNLLPRDKLLFPTPALLDAHLSWKHIKTPYLSFFSSWRRVMRRRNFLIEKGETDLHIVVIDGSKLRRVVDGEAAARRLGYSDSSGKDPRRRLSNHVDEYLVHGGIAADSYVILTIMPAWGVEVEVEVEVRDNDGWQAMRVSSSFGEGCHSNDIKEELAMDIYSHTGVWNDGKLDALLEIMEVG